MTIERVSVENLSIQADGRSLTAERHTPDDLDIVLHRIGREAIIAAIEADYAGSAPTRLRASLGVLHIGKTKSSSLSSFGQLSRSNSYPHVFQARLEHREYWHVIEDHGFAPHLFRFSSKGSDSYQLMLRNPETDPTPITPLDALPMALGFMEPSEMRNLRPKLRQAYDNNDPEAIQTLWRLVADENQAAVDRQYESFIDHGELFLRGAEAAARVGRDISEAILRVEIIGDEYLLDPERYEDALFDIHDHVSNLGYERYAYAMDLGAVDEELKQEVARVRSLREQA